MANKKQYYALDDVGFIGTQEKRSQAQIKSDLDRTVQYIKAKKSGKNVSLKKRSSKVK